MIFITGDTHMSFEKLSNRHFPSAVNLTRNDYVIVCGDFGYWSDCPELRYWLKWLENVNFTVLFVDGNHEDFNRLDRMHVSKWKGGRVHKISKNIIHLMRGQVFDIDGTKVFTFGGARSHDISDGILDEENWKAKARRLDNLGKRMYRVRNVSWWEQEMPNSKEMDEGIKNLEKAGNKVDLVITHCCASSTQRQMGMMLASRDIEEYRRKAAIIGINQERMKEIERGIVEAHSFETDDCTNYLETVKNKIEFKKWFFGHYHEDMAVNDKEMCLFDEIVRIV